MVFQVLPHTLGLGPDVWRVLDRAHGGRNLSEYKGDVSVEERLLADVNVACEKEAAALRALPPI